MEQMYIDLGFLVWLTLLSVIIFYRTRNSRIPIISYKEKKIRKNKKRYVVFRILTSSKSIDPSQIEFAVRNAVKELLGKIWLEISNPRIIAYNESSLSGIISTNTLGYKVVIASLPLIKTIGNEEVILVPFKTTGSLKKARSLIESR
ncbi:ribonuclease P [Metallosphaera tengchongensis]|uniref:Ribonuclease P protein component 2 n=1 Tax=Metallosphaera tengchongensis TaxID=1532350 RepID=A0A6N0NUQ8_9CREN|nr:Rpp14/Pop5 family protein [Metallosphaera tengchongensis]QKQ99904.1 ribonuclease P [Metallosphaera tengchongensis]